MAQYETLIYEAVADRVMRLTLNRPERLNAMSLELLGEFDQVIDEFENDADASVLIIRGAGRCFSAGYDLEDTQFSRARIPGLDRSPRDASPGCALDAAV